MKAKNLSSFNMFYWSAIFLFLLITLNSCGGMAGKKSHPLQPGAPHGKWTWVSGDNKMDQRGIYGTRNVAASTNTPGARYGSISWIDMDGNLWLFGGYGFGTSSFGLLNDLWKFDGVNWTWVSGDSKVNERGVYGIKGVTSDSNKPGARHNGTGWIDKEGNLWLFGGYGYTGTRFSGILNDLWKFDGNNWIWISGDNKINYSGVHGTKGVSSNKNKPGARYESISWTDLKGNLWLFGGYGYAYTGFLGILNDLWKFDGNNWTWVSGDSRQNEPGIYGTKGLPAEVNKPGARYGSVSWIDSKGNLWLFGGNGFNEFKNLDTLNDLWKFDGTNWTWISGDKAQDRSGVYGTERVPADINKPGSRLDSISWIDSKDNLWLFGGWGYGSASVTLLNDLWKFDGTNWTWMSGDTRAQPGVYGSKGIAGNGNKPGARSESISWMDSKGNLWLFGGRKSSKDLFNDLWKYEP